MDFENLRQQWAHAAGAWDFIIESGGGGRLGLHGFPAQERFYYDRFSSHEYRAGYSTVTVAPYVERRLLSGACIIHLNFDSGIFLKKTENTP